MLLTALQKHPQVTAYGEIFRKAGHVLWQARFGSAPRAVTAVSAWPYVTANVFHAYPSKIKAVGFKLFYYHAGDEEWQQVWSAMQADAGLHVIHIKRLNLLKMEVLRHFAHLRDSWAERPAGAGEQARGFEAHAAVLDYDSCLEAFAKTRAWHEEFDDFFQGHPRLEITYEAMAADFEAESRRVQSFLGLDYRDISPVTRKQARRPLDECLANYHELKAQFAGSEWAEFFTL